MVSSEGGGDSQESSSDAEKRIDEIFELFQFELLHVEALGIREIDDRYVEIFKTQIIIESNSLKLGWNRSARLSLDYFIRTIVTYAIFYKGLLIVYVICEKWFSRKHLGEIPQNFPKMFGKVCEIIDIWNQTCYNYI